jgi:hypothetical protein
MAQTSRPYFPAQPSTGRPPYTQRVLNDIQRTMLFSYDSARRRPPSTPLSSQQIVSLSQSSCASPVELAQGRGDRGWARSQILRPREAWSPINRSLLFAQSPLFTSLFCRMVAVNCYNLHGARTGLSFIFLIQLTGKY